MMVRSCFALFSASGQTVSAVAVVAGLASLGTMLAAVAPVLMDSGHVALSPGNLG
jgi:hypothetical protein